MGHSCDFNVYQSLQPLFSTKAGCKIHSKGRNVGNDINTRGQAKPFFGRNEISLSHHIFSQHLSLSDLLAKWPGLLALLLFPCSWGRCFILAVGSFLGFGLVLFSAELESASEVEALLVPLRAETETHPSHGRVIFLSCLIPLMRKDGKTSMLR